MSDSSFDQERSSVVRRRAQEQQADQQQQQQQQMHPLLRLQRQLGNAHVAQMLQRQPEEEELQAKHDLQRQPEGEELQAKHLQRQPEEEELQAKHLQRQPEEDELQTKRDLQRQPEVGLDGGPVSSEVADRINSKRGSGSPLDGGLQRSMESAFNTSFEGVRVHSDSESHNLNSNITAKAFTTGNDIFLGEGSSASDTNLMAHELTHVVQQRSMNSSGPMSVGPAGDQYEQEADQMASQVARMANTSAPSTENEQ